VLVKSIENQKTIGNRNCLRVTERGCTFVRSKLQSWLSAKSSKCPHKYAIACSADQSQMLAACRSRTQKRAAQQAATRRWMLGVANRRHKATQQPHYTNHTTEKWFTHAQKLHPSEGHVISGDSSESSAHLCRGSVGMSPLPQALFSLVSSGSFVSCICHGILVHYFVSPLERHFWAQNTSIRSDVDDECLATLHSNSYVDAIANLAEKRGR
jgi:hypothetical protein